jgi:hypothetical protein
MFMERRTAPPRSGSTPWRRASSVLLLMNAAPRRPLLPLRGPTARGCLLLVAVAVLSVALAAPTANATRRHRSVPRPLVTALTSDGPFFGPDADARLAFERARAAGARAIRIYTSWRSIAPSNPPAGFDPTNPADPSYHWGGLDNIVRLARGYGLEPIVSLQEAPDWAEGSPNPAGIDSPDPAALGRFALAVARRYNGSSTGLPRVRYYTVWNEPNASFFLTPQFDSAGHVVSVGRYREMVNAVADAVKSVDGSNLVVAGDLFPVDKPGESVGPLPFTRMLLCMSRGARPRPVCHDRIRFDVYSIDPYTSGYAFHAADDGRSVELGDLGSLKALVDSAVRAGQVQSSGPVPLWVMEFSWDSNPPDPQGVPVDLLRRWVAEALYQAWRSGVTLFTWFQLVDDTHTIFEGGLYLACPGGFACATAKPAVDAFDFPFVAYRLSRRRLLFWGRTPAGAPAQVVVEQRRGPRWRRVVALSTDADGIFTGTLRRRYTGVMRARVAGGGATSPSFSLAPHGDRPGTTPFG